MEELVLDIAWAPQSLAQKGRQNRRDWICFLGETGSQLISREGEWGESIKGLERGKGINSCLGWWMVWRIASRQWGPNEVING